MIETTLPLTYISSYENELKLGYGTNIPTGCYIKRDSLSDAANIGGVPVYHPEYDFIIESRNSNFFLKGSWELSWEWTAGQFTEAQIDTFISLIPLTRPGLTVSKDFANNRVVATITEADIEISGWTDYRFPWALACDNGKIEAIADNSAIFCCTFMNNTYTSYTIEAITIPAGSSLTVDKTGETHCYILCTNELVKDTLTLSPFIGYKVVSPQISLSNNLAESVRLFRISR